MKIDIIYRSCMFSCPVSTQKCNCIMMYNSYFLQTIKYSIGKKGHQETSTTSTINNNVQSCFRFFSFDSIQLSTCSTVSIWISIKTYSYSHAVYSHIYINRSISVHCSVFVVLWSITKKPLELEELLKNLFYVYLEVKKRCPFYTISQRALHVVQFYYWVNC